MNVLVTGGAGFIGSNLVDVLVARGDNVRILDDLSTGYKENIHPSAVLTPGDVADESAVVEALDGVDVVFHLGAHRAVQRSVERPLRTDTANTHGTLTVLKAALDHGVRRVVTASSSSVYGGADVLPTPESAPLWPRSPYAVTKLAGEHYARVFFELHGLETVALRFFNVYGPRQRPDSPYAAVIPLFMQALAQGKPPTIYGDGHQSRDFTYVDDAIKAAIAAAVSPADRCAGKVYNVGGGGPHSVLDVLRILETIIGVESSPVHTEPRPGDVRHSYADIAAAGRDLGHSPSVSLEKGLQKTFEWFKEKFESETF